MAGPLMLAYGIGRIGCHMSGDGDWGISNLKPKPEWKKLLPDWMWAYTYPNNVIRAGEPMDTCLDPLRVYCYELSTPVYPTAVYEALMGIILFMIITVLIIIKFTHVNSTVLRLNTSFCILELLENIKGWMS